MFFFKLQILWSFSNCNYYFVLNNISYGFVEPQLLWFGLRLQLLWSFLNSMSYCLLGSGALNVCFLYCRYYDLFVTLAFFVYFFFLFLKQFYINQVVVNTIIISTQTRIRCFRDYNEHIFCFRIVHFLNYILL